MPRPQLRTRSKKRVDRALPGGGRRIQYRGKIHNPTLCRICGQPLAGSANLSPLGSSKLTKTQKKVWRPYGGQVCQSCLKITLREAARKD